MNIPYLIVNGNITAIVGNKTYTAKSDHINFEKIKVMLSSVSADVKALTNLFDISAAIKSFSDGVVSVANGQVTYNGTPIHDLVTERIIQFLSAGQDIKPVVNFLKLRQENPSYRAAQELYKFLEHKHMPIGPDGCFYAYKGVRADYKDKFTGTIDNRVGQSPWMARSLVCDDPQRPCSPGFHAGSLAYASDWAGSDGHVMIVKINPAHVVNIPYDCNFQKLKMFTYTVVGELVNREPLNNNYTNQFEPKVNPTKCGADSKEGCDGCNECWPPDDEFKVIFDDLTGDYNDGYEDGREDKLDGEPFPKGQLNAGPYKDGFIAGYNETVADDGQVTQSARDGSEDDYQTGLDDGISDYKEGFAFPKGTIPEGEYKKGYIAGYNGTF